MTQAERYEKETGNQPSFITEAGFYEGKVFRYSKEYTEWLEARKEKAEQERDEAIYHAKYFASLMNEYMKAEHNCEYVPSTQFLDKHKDSV